MVEGLCDCCGVWGVNWGEVLGMGMLYVMLCCLNVRMARFVSVSIMRQVR